ncbi:hypothetical protein FRC00_013853 [Tulasnella sp. 408]|nr:hypothetical protein FRC00_013853 [Tulasnella sp. 408]
MTLKRGEKPRFAHRFAEAIACVPTGIQKQLTEEEVYSQLAAMRVAIIHDEHRAQKKGCKMIGLAAGVHLKYRDVLDFLASSTQLKELRLVDVKFIDAAPYQLAERLVLPHLKRLVLVDRVETIGIENLHHSIRADNCENLNLVVPGVQEMWDPRLVESIAPVVQKTFEARPKCRTGRPKTLQSENQMKLRFGRFQRLNTAPWEGASAMCKFHLGIIGDAQAQALALPDFINRVLPLAGGSSEVKLAIEDMLSGTVWGCIAFDDLETIPILLPHYFQTLAVTEVVAGVVDGCSSLSPKLRRT